MDEYEEYAEFLKKVGRTIYIDNISPDVTETVLRAAFDQFCNVTSVQFIPLSVQLNGIHAVLVEMENSVQAKNFLEDSSPFMIGGMPRPVRAKAAEVAMFPDRPRKPGRRIRCRWLEPMDPKRKVATKIKEAVKRHAKEDAYLLEQQLIEEENLAKTQSETLKGQHDKLKLIEGIMSDGTVERLMYHYKNGI